MFYDIVYSDIAFGKRELPNNGTLSENSCRLSLTCPIYIVTCYVTCIISEFSNGYTCSDNVQCRKLAVTCLLGAGRLSYSFGVGDATTPLIQSGTQSGKVQCQMLDNINEYNLLLIICVIFGQVVVPLAYSKFKTANFTSRNPLRINFYTGIYEKNWNAFNIIIVNMT